MVKAKRHNFWKSVEINLKAAAPELISVEELVDYDAVRGNNTYTEVDDEECMTDKRNRKKNKAKKRKDAIVDDDQPKKKKKKTADPAKQEKEVVKKMNQVIPKPENEDETLDMSAWDEFGLPEQIMRALKVNKFTTPTEIQKLSLPKAIVEKKDILGAAETGSGKTLAFAIPIVAALLEDQKNDISSDSIHTLILTPTRELAIQVKNHIRDLCRFTDIRVEEIVGGIFFEKQIRKLNKKPQIVVGTPGRVWELIHSGNEHLSKMSSAKFIVIDEADRMFEKGHYTELENILEKMNSSHANGKRKNDKRQVFVFSATLTLSHDPPSYLYKKKKGNKKAPKKLTADEKLSTFIKLLGLKNPAIIDITNKNVVASRISESCVNCTVEEKDYYLYCIIKLHPGRKMIFCNSVKCVKRLYRLLTILECDAKILFADMEQKQRFKNLEHFMHKPNTLLVTTNIAARGLDIANIDYIIHYQVPSTAETYVHRSGRSVREVSAHGTSIVLCSPEENFTYNKIMKTLSKEKLPAYVLSAPEIFANAKQAVNLSRKIESLETKMHDVQSNANFFEKWAKEAEIALDEDEKPEKLDDYTRKSCKIEIKKLRAQLKSVLKKPTIPLTESLRYPRFEAVQAFLKGCSSNNSE